MFYNQPLAHRFGKALADDIESGLWDRLEFAVAWVRRSGTRHLGPSVQKFLRDGGARDASAARGDVTRYRGLANRVRS